MNLTVLSTNGEVFVNCECIKGYSFKMVLAPRDKSTLLTANYSDLQDKSTHKVAKLSKSQDKSVYMTILNASCHKYKS